jgi:predicted nucleotidyltransferase
VLEENVKEIVLRYKEKLQSEFSVVKIYLFGSHARANFSEESDIDVAVIVDKDVKYEDEIGAMRLRRSIDLRIEPHVFSKKEFENRDPFINEIIKTGVLI